MINIMSDTLILLSFTLSPTSIGITYKQSRCKYTPQRRCTIYFLIYVLEPYLRQLRSFIFETGMSNIGGHPLMTVLGAIL